jgi:hypothetical protein
MNTSRRTCRPLVERFQSVTEALFNRFWSVSEAQNCHIDLVGNIGPCRLNPLSAKFDPFWWVLSGRRGPKRRRCCHVCWALVCRAKPTRRGRFLQKGGFSHATTLHPNIRNTLSLKKKLISSSQYSRAKPSKMSKVNRNRVVTFLLLESTLCYLVLLPASGRPVRSCVLSPFKRHTPLPWRLCVFAMVNAPEGCIWYWILGLAIRPYRILGRRTFVTRTAVCECLPVLEYLEGIRSVGPRHRMHDTHSCAHL